MDTNELKAKLRQIEEQAELTLREYPKTLTPERQRMIIALARYLRTEVDDGHPRPSLLDFDPERTIEGPH